MSARSFLVLNSKVAEVTEGRSSKKPIVTQELLPLASEEDKRLSGYQRNLQAKAEQAQSSSQASPSMQDTTQRVASDTSRISAVNLIVGVALIILGSLDFVSSVTSPLGCPPGSLLVQSACDAFARIELMQLWLEGASTFAAALVILFLGKHRMRSWKTLEATILMYAGLPLVLYLAMVFMGQPGNVYAIQVMTAYYLVAVVAGLVTVLGRAREFGRTRNIP